jgi:hypothetical protein
MEDGDDTSVNFLGDIISDGPPFATCRMNGDSFVVLQVQSTSIKTFCGDIM